MRGRARFCHGGELHHAAVEVNKKYSMIRKGVINCNDYPKPLVDQVEGTDIILGRIESLINVCKYKCKFGTNP